MLKRRLIPVLYLRHGQMVRSELFREHQIIGNPYSHVERMNQWDVDELIVIDISREAAGYDIGRNDHKLKSFGTLLDFIRGIAVACRIPLTFGGGIRTLDDVRERIANGADKVTLNRALAQAPALLTAAAKEFGSQAVVASIDYRGTRNDARAYVDHGTIDTAEHPTDCARRAVDLGAGEIFLTAVDRDGVGSGYDIETIQSVVEAVPVPVVACGGAGHPLHFLKCLEQTNASGVAAGNIFHFTENAYPLAKRMLAGRREDVRWDSVPSIRRPDQAAAQRPPEPRVP